MSNPGSLNRRLTLEAPVVSADGAGGVVREFETVGTLWAEVTPVSAARAIEAERAGARITHRIGIRFADDITTRHRFRDGERVFRIVSLRDRDGRKRFLAIEAEEIVP
jgi:SPP1 family predicted phage head-tail adaptor